MSFLALSHELIVEIASYLRPQDLVALMISCSRFRDVVDESLLLQYIYRTGRAGVYDPLCDFPTRSVADRMETLRRWEASWTNLERHLAAARLVISADQDAYSRCFLSNDYLFSVNSFNPQPDPERLHPNAYVDLREALRTGQYLWKQIDSPRHSKWLSQAFSVEQDDLMVYALSLAPIDIFNMRWRTILRFMSLETGGAHPLAKEPDIQLDTTLQIDPHNVRMDIIGDQIVLLLYHLLDNNYIYLVDWKQGRITLVHRAPNGTYEGGLAVLSPDLVLFLRRHPLSIELRRMACPSPSLRAESSSSNYGTATVTPDATPSLRILRTLAFPAFIDDVCTALIHTDRLMECRYERKMSSQEQACMRHVRVPAALPFHSAPEDRVVFIRFIMNTPIYPESPESQKELDVVTTVSHRALFVLAARGSPPDGCQQGPDGRSGGRDNDGKWTVEEKKEQVIVPWEEWGPQAARITMFSSIGSRPVLAHAGQRLLSLESDKLVIRDFSAARVRSACAPSRSHHACVTVHKCEENNEGKEEEAVLVGETTIPGGPGLCFGHDVVSSLPYLEKRVDTYHRASRQMLTDGKRQIIFRYNSPPEGRPVVFHVHVLEDDESLTPGEDDGRH